MENNNNKAIMKETNYNAVDRFFEAFNMSRCKTAMLLISVLVVFGYVITVLFQVPDEGLKEFVMIIVGYWIGKTAKNRDKNLTFDEYHQQIMETLKKNQILKLNLSHLHTWLFTNG